jgi:hypothetical protein
MRCWCKRRRGHEKSETFSDIAWENAIEAYKAVDAYDAPPEELEDRPLDRIGAEQWALIEQAERTRRRARQRRRTRLAVGRRGLALASVALLVVAAGGTAGALSGGTGIDFLDHLLSVRQGRSVRAPKAQGAEVIDGLRSVPPSLQPLAGARPSDALEVRWPRRGPGSAVAYLTVERQVCVAVAFRGGPNRVLCQPAEFLRKQLAESSASPLAVVDPGGRGLTFGFAVAEARAVAVSGPLGPLLVRTTGAWRPGHGLAPMKVFAASSAVFVDRLEKSSVTRRSDPRDYRIRVTLADGRTVEVNEGRRRFSEG